MTHASDGHSIRHHTSKQFDHELDGIRAQALALGGLVEEQIGLAMKALVENDPELAQEVIRDDHRVNTLEVEVNEQCTLVLARRQPAGGDLRLVVAVLKTITDLERVGDDAKRIARLALAMGEHYPRKSQLYRLGDFSGRVRMRLKETLDAFSRIDVDAAFAVKRGDDELDEEYRAIVAEQIAAMSSDPRVIPIALNLIWIAKTLERVGDRSCNICEYIIYYARGKNVRHLSLEQAAQDLLDDT